MSLFRSSATIAGFTLISRVFGFVRDMLIANIMGASMLTDAFFVAFKLPNFMRRLFAEGAFNAAFLPMFAGMHRTQGDAESNRFASETFSFMLLVLSIFTTLCILFMPWLMVVLAPGFEAGSEKFDLTVELTRITFPYLLFISLVCLLSGVLNSYEKFAAVAAAPILLNLGMIIALYGFADMGATPAHALSMGVTVSGIAQLVWLLWHCQRVGVLPRLKIPRLTQDVRKLMRLMGPAALGASVGQINLLIDVMIASSLAEAVSYLYYADRIQEFPLGVIGIAVATALLPGLSKHIRAGEQDYAKRKVDQALQLVLFFGLPCAFALCIASEPIIRFVYERGAFAMADSLQVAPALFAYSAGLPAFVCVKVLVNYFYAAQDIKTPVRIAIFCVALNLALNLLLMGPFKHVGLAMATTISGWANCLLLGIILHRRSWYRLDGVMLRFIAKSLLCCILMCAVIWVCMDTLPLGKTPDEMTKITLLIAIVGGGGVTYLASAYAMRIISREEINTWFKRRVDRA